MYFLLSFTLLLLANHSSVLSSSSSPVIFIPSLGGIIGTMQQTYFTKRPIAAYMGINYAQAPSGKRRFLPPQAFESWEDLYNGTLMRQQCPQVDILYYPKLASHLVDTKSDTEDCLTVNVFTPKIPETHHNNDELLPVLFFIHGGSFYLGSAHDFGPEFLLEKDIILVIPQYRLGVLGFSSLQTDSIAGNAGMLDILLALKWVNEHIKWFGGDPGRVTVAGQSAGAAAASALLVSPHVPKGFFSKLILQSGSVEANWAVTADPQHHLKDIAIEAGCFSSDTQEIADCLRKTPVDKLLLAHINYIDNLDVGESIKATALVAQRAGAHKFLEKPPKDYFDSGQFLKVPVMAGTTRDDGSASLAEMLHELPGESPYNRNITRRVLRVLSFQDQPNEIIDFYHNKYFAGITSIKHALPALYDLFGVFNLKAPTISIARRIHEFQPSFIYSFNFVGRASKLALSEPDWDKMYPIPTGVAHSDELGYLFPIQKHNYSKREQQMVTIMVQFWTNFIITGSPSEEWSPMTHDFGPYMRIDEQPVVYQNVFREYEVASREGYAKPAPISNANALSSELVAATIVLRGLLS